MKRLTLLSVSTVLLTNLIYSQSVEIKDGDDETIMLVNDEGSGKSSITIPSSTSAPTSSANKLYNQGGSLKWNGTTLGTGGDWANGGNIFGANSTIGNNDSYDLGFETDAITRMIIKSNGNIGIGTANPISKFSIGSTGISNASLYVTATTGTSDHGIIGNASGANSYGISGSSSGSNGMGVRGFATNSGTAANYGGYFQSWGTVGRAVYGSATYDGTGTNYGGYFEASGGSGQGVYGSASGNSGRGVTGTATNDGTGTNYGGYFSASGSSGRGVYGTASGIGGWGVNGYASNTGTTTNYGGYFQASGTAGIGVFGYSTGTNSDGVHGYATGSSGKGVVGRGNAYDFYAAGAGQDWGSSSSIRWKSNVVEIDSPIEKINELRGVYFDWDEEHGGHRDIGCIAEEVGKVLPEIVVYEENGIDADGMDYSKLTPLLIEVAKAQQKLIEDLTNRIEYLENN